MVEVEKLTKYYGRLAAIKDVSFRVESGEIVGFLGPNGAGKTTTMRILTCFSPASSGKAVILGLDARDDSMQIRQRLGYLPENVPLYGWMRVRSYLEFVAQAKAESSAIRRDEVDRVAEAAGISEVMGRPIRQLSKGFRQRVGLAQALIGDPPLLILDEPTIGLDPKQIREIRQLIKGFSRNRTVILSTHILPEVSQICDRVIIINRGTIVAEDTPANLIQSHGKLSRCQLVVAAQEHEVKQLLTDFGGVSSVRLTSEADEGKVAALIETAAETDLCPALARAVTEKGWDLFELRRIHASLEDVFIDLVTEEAEEDTSAGETEGKEVA
ncbi:MAG TPA: ABC transporter ATP-binding protein [Desulfomonilaceae bacterium]|nr:ABC transporter ATP-binding protein [Desulfomonilaceae bacterium]